MIITRIRGLMIITRIRGLMMKPRRWLVTIIIMNLAVMMDPWSPLGAPIAWCLWCCPWLQIPNAPSVDPLFTMLSCTATIMVMILIIVSIWRLRFHISSIDTWIHIHILVIKWRIQKRFWINHMEGSRNVYFFGNCLSKEDIVYQESK